MLRTLFLGLAVLLFSSSIAATAQDDQYPLLDGCKWKDETVLINGKIDQNLSFRYQDCDGTHAPKVTFALDETNALVQSGTDGATDTVAQFWPLNGRKPSEVVAAVASPSIAENEKGRCVVHLDYVNGRYSFEPNAAMLSRWKST